MFQDPQLAASRASSGSLAPGRAAGEPQGLGSGPRRPSLRPYVDNMASSRLVVAAGHGRAGRGPGGPAFERRGATP